MTRRSALVVAALAFSLPAPAQTPVTSTLLADINVEPSLLVKGSDPSLMGQSGGWTFLRMSGGGYGVEPWVTDGTPGGTVFLGDINLGANGSSLYSSVILPNGMALMAADSGDPWGVELYVAGPGTWGARLLKDIYPGGGNPLGIGSSNPSHLTLWHGEAWFYANDGVNGSEIWRSDGTEQGTVLSDDVFPGSGGISNGTNQIGLAGGKLYFTTTYPDRALYVKDTPSSTPEKLLVLTGGTLLTTTQQMADLGGDLMFIANTPGEGNELWKTDGTVAGTTMVKDIYPGVPNSNPRFLLVDNGLLWFTATTTGTGQELWLSDGTEAGTELVKDIRPGSFSSWVFYMHRTANGLVFPANDGVNGYELWTTDGTTAGTTLLVDINPGPADSQPLQFMDYGGVTYFRAEDATFGRELWKTDGTELGTMRAFDLNPGTASSDALPIAVIGSQMLISANDGQTGNEPWLTDGTLANTTLLGNFSPDPVTQAANVTLISRYQDRILFTATTPNEGSELWSTDGTPGGTSIIADLEPGPGNGSATPLSGIEAGLLLNAFTQPTGADLWLADPATGSTQLLKYFDNGSGFRPLNGDVVLNGIAYFTGDDGSGTGLWRSDGTVAGTQMVQNMPIHPFNGQVWSNAVYHGEFYFRMFDNSGIGNELWKSDGTGPGTVLVKDLEPGIQSSHPYVQGVFLDKLWIRANTSAEGSELWTSDGTTAGTQLLLDIWPGNRSSNPGGLLEINGVVLFAADDGVAGSELWASDGTTAGTNMLVDIVPGPVPSTPSWFTRSGDIVFFWARDVNGIVELWKTDGTAVGTVRVKDRPRPWLQFNTVELTPVGDGGHVVFRQFSLQEGTELWVSDGTDAGTRIFTDSWPGPGEGFPWKPMRLGEQVLFTGDDGFTGRELHAAPISNFGAWVTEPYGRGCGASISATGEARLGETVTVELNEPTGQAPAVLFIGDSPSFFTLAPGCDSSLGNAHFVVGTVTNVAGFAQVPVPVPTDPSVVGVPVYLSWAIAVPGGPFLGSLMLSNGLEVVLGP